MTTYLSADYWEAEVKATAISDRLGQLDSRTRGRVGLAAAVRCVDQLKAWSLLSGGRASSLPDAIIAGGFSLGEDEPRSARQPDPLAMLSTLEETLPLDGPDPEPLGAIEALESLRFAIDAQANDGNASMVMHCMHSSFWSRIRTPLHRLLATVPDEHFDPATGVVDGDFYSRATHDLAAAKREVEYQQLVVTYAEEGHVLNQLEIASLNQRIGGDPSQI